ncbi:MAG TPA: substrate-binding domain-containing protein [Patescibacteria group bacterium]|nr:substrate-binding domain-containing protein [Patescibacteria group bacterium]
MDNKRKEGFQRRTFLKTALASAAAAALPTGLLFAGKFQSASLQVWSCGGLSDAFVEANRLYEERNGVQINYTGAFAGALGKSLLGGAVTEVFAGRVLQLAKNLRAAEKMLYFRPLCFTEYVIITPLGNPAGIRSVEDMAKPGVRVILPLGASPPGGEAVMGLLKKANVDQAVLANTIERESCVIKMMPKIISGKGMVSIVEKRLTRMEGFAGKVEMISIPETLFPAGPMTFTIGVMKYAKDRTLADDYLNFITSGEVQAIFERCGFIPATSEKGKNLIERLGVKDV